MPNAKLTASRLKRTSFQNRLDPQEFLAYFYYFAPDQEGCTLPTTSEPQFTVRSLLPQEETFPEFDRLIEDKRIDLAVIFGAYADGEPQGSDWGVMMWRSYAANLRISDWEEEKRE